MRPCAQVIVLDDESEDFSGCLAPEAAPATPVACVAGPPGFLGLSRVGVPRGARLPGAAAVCADEDGSDDPIEEVGSESAGSVSTSARPSSPESMAEASTATSSAIVQELIRISERRRLAERAAGAVAKRLRR